MGKIQALKSKAEMNQGFLKPLQPKGIKKNEVNTPRNKQKLLENDKNLNAQMNWFPFDLVKPFVCRS